MGQGPSNPFESEDVLRAKCLARLFTFSEREQMVIMYKVQVPNTWQRGPDYYASYIGIAQYWELCGVWSQMEAIGKEKEAKSVECSLLVVEK